MCCGPPRASTVKMLGLVEPLNVGDSEALTVQLSSAVWPVTNQVLAPSARVQVIEVPGVDGSQLFPVLPLLLVDVVVEPVVLVDVVPVVFPPVVVLPVVPVVPLVVVPPLEPVAPFESSWLRGSLHSPMSEQPASIATTMSEPIRRMARCV